MISFEPFRRYVKEHNSSMLRVIKDLGLSERFSAIINQDRQNATIRVVEKICDAYNLTIDQVIEYVDENGNRPPKKLLTIDEIRQKETEQKNMENFKHYYNTCDVDFSPLGVIIRESKFTAPKLAKSAKMGEECIYNLKHNKKIIYKNACKLAEYFKKPLESLVIIKGHEDIYEKFTSDNVVEERCLLPQKYKTQKENDDLTPAKKARNDLIEKVVTDYGNGDALEVIAERYGKSIPTIHNYLIKSGVADVNTTYGMAKKSLIEKVVRDYKKGDNEETIADRYNKSVQTIRNYLTKSDVRLRKGMRKERVSFWNKDRYNFNASIKFDDKERRLYNNLIATDTKLPYSKKILDYTPLLELWNKKKGYGNCYSIDEVAYNCCIRFVNNNEYINKERKVTPMKLETIMRGLKKEKAGQNTSGYRYYFDYESLKRLAEYFDKPFYELFSPTIYFDNFDNTELDDRISQIQDNQIIDSPILDCQEMDNQIIDEQGKSELDGFLDDVIDIGKAPM